MKKYGISEGPIAAESLKRVAKVNTKNIFGVTPSTNVINLGYKTPIAGTLTSKSAEERGYHLLFNKFYMCAYGKYNPTTSARRARLCSTQEKKYSLVAIFYS